jgi:plasmid stabilization system protein ParE
MPSYELSPLAVEDLLSIQEFIARENPPAADRLIDDFFAAFDHLAQWPGSGHTRVDLTQRNVRFWPIGSYLVVYRETQNPSGIQIAAVVHAARNLPSLLRER